MSDDQRHLNELSELESQLAQHHPRDPDWNVGQLMFQAGQRSAQHSPRSRAPWWMSGCVVLIAFGLLVNTQREVRRLNRELTKVRAEGPTDAEPELQQDSDNMEAVPQLVDSRPDTAADENQMVAQRLDVQSASLNWRSRRIQQAMRESSFETPGSQQEQAPLSYRRWIEQGGAGGRPRL